MRISDWSSDVCSSDLAHDPRHHLECGGIAHAADKEEQQHHGEEQWEAVRRQRPDHAGCCNHLHDEHPEGDKRATGPVGKPAAAGARQCADERSEEHTSELQSLMRISYAVFCLKTKKPHTTTDNKAEQL